LQKWLKTVIGAVFIVTFILSVIATRGDHQPGAAFWHYVPGFYILLGLAGCIAFILVSKWLGKHFLQRDDQYYEKR
jgi:uncharacterized membrane protein